ncbi:MAG: tRNA uridine-5-carboxymethylaminomethyl(34) synthesis GTPase MnmE [Clostridia bacterium]|nr:tRNA uridine-5-carboxymethylaminomethyl(34) synthesis GTPase MnmE [Clostridia bacterium]
MSEHFSTIAAISTPPGKGGVALIRVSGPEAFAVVLRVFRPRGKSLPWERPRTAVYGDFLSEGEVIDDGLVTAFPAPASYTGEDTVELSCHGGVLITRTLLEALFLAGAVPAPAGEFTRRAYLSGRLGLTEAEAIATLLDAKSTAQVRLSAARGVLAERLDAYYRELLTLTSSAEAVIDFPEEDLAELSTEELTRRLHALREGMTALTGSYRTGRSVTEGVRAVIVGRPNVGKSCLYNLLVGEEAAIVSDTPGTTRDLLERTVPLGRVLLRLTDTAGLHASDDPIETLGMDRARRAMEEAELLLSVFDASAPLTDEDRALMAALPKGRTAVAILNKSDLPTRIDRQEIEARFENLVEMSATCGTATALCELCDRLFTDGALSIGEDPIVSSARQYAALCRTCEALTAAEGALLAGMPADMYLADLEAALSALGEVDGRTVNEEIVREIFSHFCVGK